MKKKDFLNTNAMNTAKGMRKVEHAKVQPKHIDVYLDAEARDDDPERTDLKRDETNVRPESKYYKDLDPMKLGGVKISARPNAFGELMSTTGPLKIELQKHHLQRAAYRLTDAKKKQSFEDLLQNYFHVNALDTAKEKLNQLLNTPVRPLTEPELTSIEAQLQSHDARLLNDTNALMHIIFDSRLRQATQAAMTNDQWSKLLKYALLSMYQRTAQAPPPWLGGDGHTKDTTGIPTVDDTPVPTGNTVRTETGEVFPDPTKNAVNQKEAGEQIPETSGANDIKPGGKKIGFERFYDMVLKQLRERSESAVMNTAHNILNRTPFLPQPFADFIDNNEAMKTLDPEGLNARTAVGVIREAFVTVKANWPASRRGAGYTDKMFQELQVAIDNFFLTDETAQTSGEPPP
jgi:hypothetical protein